MCVLTFEMEVGGLSQEDLFYGVENKCSEHTNHSPQITGFIMVRDV